LFDIKILNTGTMSKFVGFDTDFFIRKHQRVGTDLHLQRVHDFSNIL